MPNLVRASRNMIEFIEQNEVVHKYEDDFSESGEYSQGQKLEELMEELNEAIDASTELPDVRHAQTLISKCFDTMLSQNTEAIDQLTASFKKLP